MKITLFSTKLYRIKYSDIKESAVLWFNGAQLKQYYADMSCVKLTAWKVFVFGVSLICIISTFSFRIRENMDQKNSEYGHFSRSDYITILIS